MLHRRLTVVCYLFSFLFLLRFRCFNFVLILFSSSLMLFLL